MSYARKLDDVTLLLDELESLQAPASSGKPLEISLSLIEEDPNQPRRAFDANTLEELAASIRERGVLQPIGLSPAGLNGMHRIVFGARRFRAAQLAGRATIAAFIHSGEASDPYDQMIENIQRDDLSAADIAAFVTSRLAAGEKQKDIALRLGKDKSYIAMYASVTQMAPMLRERLETSPIRAVYELHQMWKHSPQAVEAFCSEHDSFTRVQVVVFSEGLSARPSRIDDSSLIEALNGAVVSHGEHESGELVRLDRSRSARDEASRGSRRPARSYAPSKGTATMLRVEHGLRSGRLILDRESSKGETHGLVSFDDECTVEDLPLAALKLVGLRTRLSST